MSYLGSTWAGSCVASFIGSIYAACIVLSELVDDEPAFSFIAVFVIGVFCSLPILFAGSLVVGQFLSSFLVAKRYFHRPTLFSLCGAFLGLLIFLIFCVILDINPVEDFIFCDVGELLILMKLASIFVVYLAVAGLVTALHIDYVEQE